MVANTRLRSLDVFRGITVLAMILVNNPGNWGKIYAPLKHAAWNGCTPTDLVFPFFLFIVGVSIAYALASSKLHPETHNKTLLRIVRRGLTLFALGLFLSLFPKFAFETVRIPGVLQRIGVVFILAAIIFLKTEKRMQLLIMAVLLVGYWLVMMYAPVSGIGQANLQPTTNLAAWLDNTLLPGHLWSQTKVWDPEGILSTLPAVVTALLGVQVGQWLKRKDEPGNKIAWLMVWGVICTCLGLIWDLHFPINKSLWTSSYVLYSGGLAMLGLGLCYWLIDVKGYRKLTTPFLVYGVNAITVFFLSGLIPRIMGMIKVDTPGGEVDSKTYLYNAFYTTWLSPYNASLAWALTWIFFWMVILYVMYRKNIIIKV
ncbi:N-acetylglucosamine related transporter, NagX [Rufibacter radiotolerans]|uniref:N-acetylglucosamine related transporter, NagX n=1 Tax=Rufibacter radiotolerans TaxID=1379910 RepID=A0A0H4VMJ0_9BACT|nr:heparan-alpha-glucosaminide N-acetyltransferase domain-containing protein [Rufibacter radiotolerans]AKQ47075.1 N-acetylglucosamine related transporter, NagX [Rufibacter radiotolerans]